jgi:hypothetical protein
MGTSSGTTCSWPGCDQAPTWGQIESGVWMRLCAAHLHPDLERHRLSLDPTASEASSAPTPDEGETGSDSDRLAGRERASAGESQKRGVIYHTRRVINLPPAIWCFAVGSIGALAALMRSLTFPGAGSSRPAPDSGGKVPSNMERRLFDASAYSNPFWSDTIDNENLKNLRHEIQRRWQVQGHALDRRRVMNVMSGLSALACVSLFFVGATTDTGRDFDVDAFFIVMGAGLVALLFFCGFIIKGDSYRQIVNAGVTYRWPWIYKRSVARFEQWLGSMGSTDPHLYAEVVNWLQRERQHAEEMARLAAIQRAQEAAEDEQRYQEQRYQEQERKAASAAWTAQHHAAWNEQRIREHDERDRRRTGANYQYEQEQARQAAFYESDRLRAEQAQRYENEQARQAGRMDRRTNPTCYICGKPGAASTASGWMCGLHTDGLL